MASSNTVATIPVSALVPRRLQSWIGGFVEYTEVLPSPVIFRKWAAVAAIAGALERKVWVRTLGSNLYPNLYTILVAPPGVGKTVALTETTRFWRELPNHHIAPSSVTKAALVDALFDAKRNVMRPGQNPPFVEFNSLLIPAGELGVLLPAYENDFMNVLTDIYDGNPYAERRRTKDLRVEIKHPQLNILGATTPSYLNAFMPEGAWDQGFISRTILVYSGERVIRDLFSEPTRDKAFTTDLAHDLKTIGSLFGEITFEPDAASAISAWHRAGGPPVPEHPKLAHYLTRRTAHLLKLCMVFSVDRSSSLVISLEDYQSALNLLLEAETFMPDIFKSMTTGGEGKVIEEAWYFLYEIYVKSRTPIHEHRLTYFLQSKVPTHAIQPVIETMIRSKMIRRELTGSVPALVPVQKHERQ